MRGRGPNRIGYNVLSIYRHPTILFISFTLDCGKSNMADPIYKRILLKLSGEALAAGQGFGVDNTRVHEIAAEVADVHRLGVQIGLVVGGGNFFRGVAEQARDMDRVSADHMGMLATMINRWHCRTLWKSRMCIPG